MIFENKENCSSKILNLLDYFSNEGKKDKTEKKYAVAVKLEKMIDIYNSDLNDVRKFSEMNKIYKHSSDFIQNFSLLQLYRDDEQLSYYANIAKEIGEYFKELEEKGLKEIGKELLKLEEDGYFEDFSRACYYVEEYIKYDESSYIKDFLLYVGISQADFSRFVDIVMELDSSLYDEYVLKTVKNANSRKYDTYTKVNNLVDGVKNGYLPSGEKFDEIEFYRNLPFYEKETAQEIYDDFFVKNDSAINQKLEKMYDESSYIKEFLNNNNLSLQDFSRFVNVIIQLDSHIYDEYIKKYVGSSENEINDIYRKIINIASGIRTGYLPSGEKFNDIELLRNLPFNDKNTIKRINDDFSIKSTPTVDQKLRRVIEIVSPSSTRDVTNYMVNNKLFVSNQTIITRKDINEINFINNDEVLEESDKKRILDYMEETNVPPLMKAFNILKNRCLEEKKSKKLKK